MPRSSGDAQCIQALVLSLSRARQTVAEIDEKAGALELTIGIPAWWPDLDPSLDHRTVEAHQLIEVLNAESHPDDPGRILGSIHRLDDWTWIGHVVVVVL